MEIFLSLMSLAVVSVVVVNFKSGTSEVSQLEEKIRSKNITIAYNIYVGGIRGIPFSQAAVGFFQALQRLQNLGVVIYKIDDDKAYQLRENLTWNDSVLVRPNSEKVTLVMVGSWGTFTDKDHLNGNWLKLKTLFFASNKGEIEVEGVGESKDNCLKILFKKRKTDQMVYKEGLLLILRALIKALEEPPNAPVPFRGMNAKK